VAHERHIGLLMDPAEERLARVLIGLASCVGCTLKGGIQIDIKNEDLASLADVSRFTASRLLKQWERKGAVEKSRGKVHFCTLITGALSGHRIPRKVNPFSNCCPRSCALFCWPPPQPNGPD
jgi:hypothetical protein